MSDYIVTPVSSQEPSALEMLMLPGFETIPEVPLAQTKKAVASNIRYYLRIQTEAGEWYFLWKTHSNGGCEWVKERTMGKKRPLRYKTIYGAQRQLYSYTSRMIGLQASLVAVWNGGKS